jgi:membrane fusion protein (multidrug efflux system)
MPATFTSTLRSLEADGARRRTLHLFVLALVVCSWLAWLVLGDVTVYRVTSSSRVETEGAAHLVAAPVEGRVVGWLLDLGREVRRGDVLVELDGVRERRAIEEARTRLEGYRARGEALRREVEAAREAAAAHREAGPLLLGEAEAQLEEVETQGALRAEKATTSVQLRKEGLLSEEGYRESQTEARSSAAAVKRLRLAGERLAAEHSLDLLDRLERIARLGGERVEVENQVKSEEAAIRRLEHELELRLVRSPVDGRVGKSEDLRAGAVVRAADVLGAIVPEGKARLVAYFPTSDAGKLSRGQPARLRLDAFPWTQYGMPAATVTGVGNEPEDGHVRVELALDALSAPGIPLAHGLSGTTEVAVERASPACLLLRAVGKALTTRPSTGGAPGPSRPSERSIWPPTPRDDTLARR